MNLFEYIKSQLPSMPNVAIMKDMDASDELIEYIRHTTWNTNLGMLAAYGCEPEGGGGDEDTWVTIKDVGGVREFDVYISEDGSVSGQGMEVTTTKPFASWQDLCENGNNYSVEARFDFPNGTSTTLSLSYADDEWRAEEGSNSISIGLEFGSVEVRGSAHDESSDAFANTLTLIVTKK